MCESFEGTFKNEHISHEKEDFAKNDEQIGDLDKSLELKFATDIVADFYTSFIKKKKFYS